MANAPPAHHAAPRWRFTLEHDGVVVVENRHALPRAWIVRDVRAVSGQEALRIVRGEAPDDFDPRYTALLELDGAPPPSVIALASDPDSALTDASRDGHISVETQTDGAAFLVVSESYFPGWEATLDGNAVRIYRTDYLLQGVAVPAGAHRVELMYTAPGAVRGAVVSLGAALALLSIAALILWGLWRRSRASAAPLPNGESSR